MLEEEVLACSFDRWYDRFHGLTFRSRVIPLPEDFVQYLLADGIALPAAAVDGERQHDADGSDSEGWGDGGGDSDSDGAEPAPSFPELEREIVDAIQDLGGAVLPKLNWSAPKDARWMLGCGLKCTSLFDVLTLLKGSDFVAHDLEHSLDYCARPAGAGPGRPERFVLVLRQWRDLDDSGEFRCFVGGGRLLAISQRQTAVRFPHLSEESFLDAVRSKIVAFFEESVSCRFPLERYAFDVLVGKAPRLKVRVVDFSPWGPSTDPVLFEWDYLAQLRDAEAAAPAEVRVVRTDSEVKAKLENYHQLPLEVAQLGSQSPEDLEALFARAEANLQS